ncbi:hypothetical protein AB0H76_15205 [Nocardia sp. NPDC050712]|uniref:hypothetical protein n=1 Tax=Nocardia sp. NPDC050712 TaxID=3155518 RepID=UPI0033E14AA3
MDELDRAVAKHERAKRAENDTRAELHAVIRKVLTERADERGAQADVSRRTGYTRETLRLLMKEGTP